MSAMPDDIQMRISCAAAIDASMHLYLPWKLVAPLLWIVPHQFVWHTLFEDHAADDVVRWAAFYPHGSGAEGARS
jgi:hypothetical protein